MTEVHDPDPGERSVVTGERRGGCRARFTERGKHLVGVLTDYGGRADRTDAFAIDLEETGRQHHRAAIGLDMVEAAPSLKVRVHQHIVGLEDRRADDAAVLTFLGHLEHRHRREQLGVEGVEHGVGDAETAHERLVLGVLQIVRLAEPGPHRLPVAFGDDHEPDVPVLARQDRVDGPRTNAAVEARHACIERPGPVRQRPVGDLGGCFVHRQIDDLPGAGGVLLDQRTLDGEDGVHRCGVVGDIARRQQGFAFGHPCLEGHAGGGVDHGARHVSACVGAGSPVGGDRTDDQMGMAAGKVVGIETAVGPRAGLGGVDHDITAGQQFVEAFAIRVLAEIEFDTLLPGVAEREEEGLVADDRQHRSGG